ARVHDRQIWRLPTHGRARKRCCLQHEGLAGGVRHGFPHGTLLQERALSAGSGAADVARALSSNRRIGIAVGILMRHRLVTADQAVSLLMAHSQEHNVRVRGLAERVIGTGAC
ncbi:MAG: ANTAR domain-containing protein, partial [Marmoricola sp.]|nr:ANTAR domain-containing protein [Marmoricola sp.]